MSLTREIIRVKRDGGELMKPHLPRSLKVLPTRL